MLIDDTETEMGRATIARHVTMIECNGLIKKAFAMVRNFPPDTKDELALQLQEGILLQLKRQDRNNGTLIAPNAKTLVEYLTVARARRIAEQDRAETKEKAQLVRDLRRIAKEERRAELDAESARNVEKITAAAVKVPVAKKPPMTEEDKKAWRYQYRAKKREAAAARKVEWAIQRKVMLNRAQYLFEKVCSYTGAAQEDVRRGKHGDLARLARQVYAIVGRDTSYCGPISFPLLSLATGKATGHATVHTAFIKGKASAATLAAVRQVCERLGIQPPAYAVGEKGSAA